MKAKFIYEKFVEDSDPIEDLGIDTRKQISKFMKEIDEKDTDDNALVECAANGKTQWVKFLIARGADVHAWNNYALRWAANKGHTEIVKILLDAGADVHAWNDYALRCASEEGHTETVKVIQDHITKEKKAKEVNEKFVEDSDPVGDLISGFNKKRTVETEEQAVKYIVRILPQILNKSKIPEDIINIQHYYIKPTYWHLINKYINDYITVTNETDPILPIKIYKLLFEMGFVDKYHYEKYLT